MTTASSLASASSTGVTLISGAASQLSRVNINTLGDSVTLPGGDALGVTVST